MRLSLPLFHFCLSLSSALLCGAADKPDLNRTEPVPPEQSIPVADFFRPPLVSNARLNPAGTHLAAIYSLGDDRRDLMLYDIKNKRKEVASAGGKGRDAVDISTLYWLGDDRLLFSATKGKLYARGLYVAKRDAIEKALPLVRHSVTRLVSIPEATPDTPLIWILKDAQDAGRDRGVLRLDAAHPFRSAPATTLLLAPVLEEYPGPPSGSALRYLDNARGELTFCIARKDGRALLWLWKGKEWERSPLDLETWNLCSAGDKDFEVIASRDPQPGKPSSLVLLDAASGAELKVLHTDKDYSLSKARIHREGRDNQVTGISYQRKTPFTLWLDDRTKALVQEVEKVLPERALLISSSSRNKDLYLFASYSDRCPPEYHLLDTGSGKLGRLAASMPWIDPERMRPMQRLPFQSRDGLLLDAYVTLPAGVTKTHPAPLVVLPHGGPFLRDVWGWNPQVQFLASRGYAVLQPNYRGSAGYDWSMPAGDPLLFRRMHDDVTDATHTLLRTGLVDRSRIAIMGGSFGAYLALCGVAYEPDLYRCAITIAGVFDWERMIKESKSYDESDERANLFLRALGDPKQLKDAFEQISPLRHIASIKVPVYVAHGAEDQTAYIEESKALIAELSKHGVPYKKQLELGEGHGFQILENKIELYSGIETFLARNLASTTPPSAP